MGLKSLLGPPRAPMSAMAGHAALGAAKVANTIAHKQAAYDFELAKHASVAAQEMENTRRLIERYILGTEVETISDVEPTAGIIEGGHPPEYSAFPYPLGHDKWPTNYPVPAADGPLKVSLPEELRVPNELAHKSVPIKAFLDPLPLLPDDFRPPQAVPAGVCACNQSLGLAEGEEGQLL
eukprot:CAMPEP_0206618266 /NCGR_PEP_ID=MMETSP0325_2-20121206/60134_1 /ASSEMBLY_ACC=CAM_ASM_000347 /TAXON_ID=2866 /ORGANISM="Crypthecodinium cohnii, Strain Seligo" /LENGTH=179 /DNA_ID=CAMNT_0054140419 /DNA_START=111 /DNA_END=650 /DNA_ORIENTATION=+